MKRITHIALLLGCGAFAAANGAIITYNGFDAGASAPGTNSTTARSAFIAATGANVPITFELLPLGSANNLVVVPGVTTVGASASISNSTLCTLPLCGGNTTPAGAKFLEVLGGTVLFNFATPIPYFGAYFGGLQNATTISFNNGAPQSIPLLAAASSSGGFAFVGFTDFGGGPISSVSINAGGDILTVDDVLYPVGAGVPEPSTFVLMGVGLLVLRNRLPAPFRSK